MSKQGQVATPKHRKKLRNEESSSCHPFLYINLSGWWFLEPPIWKICSSNWVDFPNFRGQHKRCLKPPPSYITSTWSKSIFSYFFGFKRRLPDRKLVYLSPRDDSNTAPNLGNKLENLVVPLPHRNGHPLGFFHHDTFPRDPITLLDDDWDV